MQIEPQASAFAKRYARGEAQVVWTTLVADLETPVSAFLKIAGGRPMSFLLELVEGGAVRGRYSIIGLEPDIVWRTVAGRAEIDRTLRGKRGAFVPCKQQPLAALRALVAESRIDLPDVLPPMAAGIFGYLGYDMVRLMEELPAPNPDPIGLPDAVLVRPTIVVVFDAVKDTITVVTPVRPEKSVSAKTALARANERLSSIVDALDQPLDHSAADGKAGSLTVLPTSNTPAAEYERMVRTAKEYIAAGDIFQVVLSQRFEAPFELPPFSLYRALRRVNPSPYLYFLDFEDFAIAGSSPEILVKVSGGTVTVRPIAGTRPRGATPHEDKALEVELLADPKERAEHLMLLDLGRNDTGRVSEIGTVKVTDQFFVERYSQVMHIVSNVEGTLSNKHDSIDALAAGFPGRHRVRRSEGTRDGDHRRVGEGKARALRRRGRLLFGRRRDGHMHRAAHGAGQGRHDVCAGRRRHRRRLQSKIRAAGMRQQGQGAISCSRRSEALRKRRAERAVASGAAMLATPGFHHLHLNSVDPDAAIDFYVRQFPSTSKTSWGGFPALRSPTNVLILFTKVAAPPPTSPRTAIWHFGWHVVDSRKSLETYKSRPDVRHFPLYTSDEGGTVLISSDTWPAGAALGLTRSEIAEAKAKGIKPTRERGFAYLQGPDGAIVEYLGNFPAERMNHVHLFQEHPFCAQLWYQKHLNAPAVAGRDQSDSGDRSQLPGAARTRPLLAGHGTTRALPHAAGGG